MCERCEAALRQEVARLKEDVADAEAKIERARDGAASWEEQCDIAREELAEMRESAWELAARLHDEAHADDRTPFVFCQRQTCIDLKDQLNPGWREHRPATFPRWRCRSAGAERRQPATP